MIELPPDAHILESLRAERPKWPLLFGEAVDNSFDAGAKNIEISFLRNAIIIKDDGIGVTKDRILSLVQLGRHRPTGMTALGRYGVGIKYQAIMAGDILQIGSTSIDGRVQWRINWQDVIDSGKWLFENPSWTPTTANTPSGTSVVIKQLRSKPPERVGNIVEELSAIFYPALVAGRSIKLNGHQIEVLPYPDLTLQVDETLTFDHGKTARVRGGLLVDPKSRLRLVNVSYLHRVIMPRTSFGCGDVTGPMFARVELSADWKISKFKDDLIDDQRDELDQALQKTLADILEKCRSQSMATKIEEIQRKVNALLPPDLQPSRPEKNNPQNRKGKKRGNKNQNPTEDSKGPKGPTSKKNPSPKLQIVFDDAVNEKFGIGFYDDKSRPRRIILAKDNPRIAELLKTRESDLSAKSLFDIALCIYASEQPKDLFDRFGKKVAELFERHA